ncbi:hypothetical protein SLEP1_g28944 [Rubroshorea leprosula]|uniref:Uncharacterized protein n=1 Tax=Rubroshorea leprosula TaxID=152421 RepID=A0AAV5K4L7_9ROSI|nr:hypothetical protein SLEP1_g28944 [Rubroshorea leprosula]
MAELIVGPLMDVMISKVISVTTEQLNLAVGFEQQLEKLPGMLGMLKGVLQDAEQKKVSHSGKNVRSRVLITTRSEKVACTMGTLSEHMHHLEKLADGDCWSIIKQRAFVSSSFSLELEGIGRDIASKCRGLALAANVIGGSLCNSRKKDDWLLVKNSNEVWGSIEEANGVLRVLQLSFNRLPTLVLKQCFAFCSIFPKGFVLEKEMLIQLWMAEGFLQPFQSFSETQLEMEDIGDKPLKGIWDLLNLRHIYFNDRELMPARIGRLTCLKTLQLFVVGRQKEHQIEELRCLSQLKGKLEICNLHMVRDKEEAIGARLSEKATIQELQLAFGGESNGSEDRCKHDEDILEGLQPHSNLKGLIVECYCGKSCPTWMSEIENPMSERVNFLKNLVFISLYQCPWLERIPSLSLNDEAKVEINYCKNLKSIACSSLQKLIIEGCEELVGVKVGPVAMKSLKEVHIERCGLTSLPSPHVLSSLQKVQIYYCGELKSIGESLSIATCLKGLTLSGCKGLTSLPSLHWLFSLQTLLIRDCGGLRSLPSGLPSCTALEELAIANCHNLISIPDDLRRSWSIPNPACLARLKKLTIGGFSTELKEFPDLGFI